MWTPYFAGVVSIFFFFFSSPNLSGLRLDVYHSANLERRSEMYYTQLAGNTGPKNDAKKIAICAPSHNFVKLYLRN